MYIPLESIKSAAPQQHLVQATEKEVDGSQALVIGVSTRRAKPPLLLVVPGSDLHTITDHCSSRLLTLLAVQDMLKNLFVVVSILNKNLPVLRGIYPLSFLQLP